MRHGLLALAVIVAAAAIWWFGLREDGAGTSSVIDPAPSPNEEPSDAGPLPAKAPELEAKGKAPAAAAVPTPDAPPTPKDSVSIRGRVLDERRRPVAGATVTLTASYDAPPTRPATTAADGRFEIRGLVRPFGEVWRSFLVRATYAGKAGLGGAGIWAQSRDVIDVGVITLRPAHALEVAVRSEAATAISGAQVFLETKVQWTRSVVEQGRTGPDGTCAFETLAPQTYRVLAAVEGHGRAVATVTLPRTESGPVVLTLGTPRALTVVVTDKDTGQPIQGATLLVEEHVRGALGIAGQIVPYLPPIEGLFTDAEGRVALPGVGAQDAVQVHALAPGYPHPGGARMVRGSTIVDDEIRIQLQKLRTVKWPIAADSEHTPPDGTELRLEQARGAMTRPLPPAARIEGDYVVAEDCDPQLFHVVAIAPDGAYARMMVLHNSNEGREVKFLRPRKVVVLVDKADGTPAEGIYVSMRNQGNNVIVDPTPLDPDGRLELDVRYAWLLDVFISTAPNPYGGQAIGSLDLKKGGGTVRGTLPAPGGQIELTVLIDGEARLPPTYRMGYGAQSPTDVEEDPGQGIVRFRLPESVKAGTRWSFSAAGFLNTTFEIPTAAAGATAKTRVELKRGGHCIVRIKVPADGKHRSNLHKEGSKTPGFALPRMGSAPKDLGTMDGWLRIRHGPLEPGTYRAHDSLSRARSAAVEVREGAESTIDLDLSGVTTLKGVVEVPDGFDVRKARVQVGGDGLYTSPFPGMASGAYVAADGSFQVRIPGTRKIRLTASHPVLVPAPDSGSVEVTEAIAGLRLKLVEGGGATFRLDPPVEQSPQGMPGSAVTVLLYEGEPAGKALQVLRPDFKDGLFTIAGFKPGTFTLVVNARKRAPAILTDVTLGKNKTDVGTITLPEGATVRIRLKIKEGEDAPRIFASAHAEAPIAYTRFINSNGEREVLLKGLGAGTFELRAQSMRGFGSPGATGNKALNEKIECDGRTEIVRELDLR